MGLINNASDYVKVHNLNGTTDNNPPKGYNSWKEWWEEETGREFNLCSKRGCVASATDGSHVQKIEGSKKWYIVPLCKRCNLGLKNVTFEVLGSDLVAVNKTN